MDKSPKLEDFTGPSEITSDMADIFADVIRVMKEIGRTEDFIGALTNIANGKLRGNIALHLLLDVGQFLRQETLHSMRYSNISKDFWT